MVSRWPRIPGLLFVFVVLVTALAYVQPAAANSKYASLVIDANTGEDIRARNADSPRYPASLTKIMTLYIVFEEIAAGRLKSTDRITFSAHAAAQAPSKLGLKEGESLTVDNAIRALVTKSANDVAAAIAEHIAGSETSFARRMTETAHRLGMTHTTFRNASGLPNREQTTTARDMATLGLRIMRDFPRQYEVFQTKSFTYRGRTYSNHNRLLGTYAGTDGIKTGYIRDSGYNLVASVRRGNRHAIAVVMGGKTGSSRDAHMRAILDESFPKLAEYFGPPPRAKPDLIAALESADSPAPEGDAGGDAEVAATVTPVSASAPEPEAPVAATAVEPAPAAAPEIPHGVVRLTMVPIPPRSHELPLTEPVSRDTDRIPGTYTAGRLIRPTEARAAVIGATRVAVASSAAASYPSAPAPVPAGNIPPAAASYAPTSAGSDQGDAIERLIAAAMAEPAGVAPVPAVRPGHLILPRPTTGTVAAAEQPAAGPAPASAPSHTPTPEAIEIPDGYQIQVGAYVNQGDAQARLERVQETARELLAEAMGFTPSVEKDSGQVFYRARFAGLGKDEAHRACRTLKQRKIDCIVVAQ